MILPNVFWNVGFGVSGALLSDCVMGQGQLGLINMSMPISISQHASPLGHPLEVRQWNMGRSDVRAGS